MYRFCSLFLSVAVVLVMFLTAFTPRGAYGQQVAKYGADFLAGGVGGRALGMGGAHVGLVENVTAGYWNPAGLQQLDSAQVAYMHAERFAGFVSFDYAAGGMPVTPQSAVAFSIVRSGVNDIKNTLHAWDPERDQPLPHPEDHITEFSAADYAFLISYSRAIDDRLTVGGTGKLIRRSIGDFATAWGYSVDVGLRYGAERYVFGLTIQDLTTMLQTWNVDREKLAPLQEIYDLPLPEGGTELVLPVLRLGSGYVLPVGPLQFTFGADTDVAVDGYRAFAFNLGELSFHPRIGMEMSYQERIALRVGANQLTGGGDRAYRVTPTVGAGLNLRRLVVDYSFGHFAGMAADLGYSHRISVLVNLGMNADSSN